MYYPPAIREDTSSGFEVRNAPEQVEAASLRAAVVINSSKETAKESGPSRATGTDEGQNPDTPKETVGSKGDDPISHIKGLVIVVEPLQSVPLGEGSKDSEISHAQPS